MELIDITDTLVFEDEPSIFNEDTALDLIESALHLMEDYLNENPTAVSEPDFHETMLEEIKDIFALQFEDHTTPLRIENAQSASSSSLITAPEGGVLNERRCKLFSTFQLLRKVGQNNF